MSFDISSGNSWQGGVVVIRRTAHFLNVTSSADRSRVRDRKGKELIEGADVRSMNVFAAVELDLQNLTPLRVASEVRPGPEAKKIDRTHSMVVVGTDNNTFLAYCLSGGDIYRDNIARLQGNG